MKCVLKSDMFYCDEYFKLNAFQEPPGRGVFYEGQRGNATWTQ
jgi:hypothetical protein